MNKDNISRLFATIKRRPEIAANVPMSYTPGLPALSVRNDNLCVEMPFLRYKITGQKDRTLVFPVRYVATYLVPEMILVRFVDLAYEPGYEDVDFDRPIGFFRHEAIAGLTRGEYDALRRRTLAGIDLLAGAMLGDAEMSEEEHERFRSDYSRLIEPSLIPFYYELTPDFSEKYISNGQNS